MLAVATSGSNQTLLMKKLHRQFSSRYLEDNNIISRFPSLADSYCNGIARYLKKTYIQLTPFDISVCSMIALGISPQCISSVYGFEHYGTIYNKFSSIRKKLDVPQNIELEAFISDLSKELKKKSEKAIRKALVDGTFRPLIESDILHFTE